MDVKVASHLTKLVIFLKPILHIVIFQRGIKKQIAGWKIDRAICAMVNVVNVIADQMLTENRNSREWMKYSGTNHICMQDYNVLFLRLIQNRYFSRSK